MTPIAAILAGVLAQTFSYRVAFGAFAVLCVLLIYPFFTVLTPARMAQVDAAASGTTAPPGHTGDEDDLPEAAEKAEPR
jgi:hypothetical protein